MNAEQAIATVLFLLGICGPTALLLAAIRHAWRRPMATRVRYRR